ncbi:hypothetical protein [Nocardiopsis lucentensis]|uniref:hypothetical protein n=1 Tax=Nocardiopsis lucentensis TaxID=53441 RepID=UPI000592E667|nr:hypothetical protein [Nocardiopsis lucentensis]
MLSIEVFAGQVLTTDVFNATRKRFIVQTADQILTNQTTPIPTEIVIPVEAGATYVYECLVSLSAVADSDSALAFNWNVPTGTLLARFTHAYDATSATSLNSGAEIIQRRPANTTLQIAGGSDASSPPSNFHSAVDRGTIAVGGVSGNVILEIQQSGAGSANETILRGGNQTRAIVERIL